jgi:NADPH-dependent glutamate synthase beta subunit-like oxidoreductase
LTPKQQGHRHVQTCAATTANAPWTPTPFCRQYRRPFTDGLGLAELGVEISERGQIKTDAHYQTNVAGIYALGDCIDGPMLAHKAEDEGGLRRRSGGQKPHVNYGVIPVIYTTRGRECRQNRRAAKRRRRRL